jgi:hypothetical protein
MRPTASKLTPDPQAGKISLTDVSQIVREKPLDFALELQIQSQVDDRTKSTSLGRSEVLLRVNRDMPDGDAPWLAALTQESA